MSWMEFSNYDKRIWDINFQDNKIHLAIVVKLKRHTSPYVEVTWTADKFRNVKFSFRSPYRYKHRKGYDRTGVDWKIVFSKLRISLAYGLNQSSRAVTDRLLQVGKNQPHPIHQMVRTSKAI